MIDMRIMVSYKCTGEPIDKLDCLLSTVCSTLCSIGEDPYCMHLAKASGLMSQKIPSEMMKIAFAKINESDALLVIQASESRSEGMLMEVGYAIANKMPILVATHSSVSLTYLPSLADVSIIYDDIDHLRTQIEKIDFLNLRSMIA